MSRIRGKVYDCSAVQKSNGWFVRITLDDKEWLMAQGFGDDSLISQTASLQLAEGESITLDTDTLRIFDASGNDVTSPTPLPKDSSFQQP